MEYGGKYESFTLLGATNDGWHFEHTLAN